MVTKNIYSEVLLELAFHSSNESEEELILKNAIPHFLRKLNCFMAAVLKKSGDEYYESKVIPFVMNKSDEWQKVKSLCNTITSTSNYPCAKWTINDHYYYVFHLKSYGLFIIGRKKIFDDILLYELKPIINHLAKNLSIGQEISNRIRAEELLKDKEKSLRTVLQSTAASILIFKQKNIIYSNPAAERLTGYILSELKSMNIYDLIHPDYISFVKESNPTTEGESFKKQPHFEIKIIKKNKRIVWLDVRAGIIQWKGERAGIISAFDITKRKRMELKLIKAKEEAEKNERLKSAFLANMSHEIRTPLNGILGFSDLLKTPSLSEEKRIKYLEIIEKSGNRLLNLINNILDVSKIEANLMKTNFIETNINECLDDLYSFFNPEAVKKNIRFSYQKELPDTKALISTDAEKLNAILINLIKNALKYTDEGFIEFGYKLNSDSNYIEFYVEDSGIGILKNKQEAIFERFIQADINDKHAKEGIGLGLAICKAYVFMLGGEIRLNSSINKGTRFYFTIPFLNVKGIKCDFETVSNEKN